VVDDCRFQNEIEAARQVGNQERELREGAARMGCDIVKV